MRTMNGGSLTEKEKQDCFLWIAEKKKEYRTFVLAIEGRAASGKSTLAEEIAEKFQASIIHMDDFFLPLELRTRERYEEPGGNVHYERFIEEILLPLAEGRLTSYRKFSCSTMSYEEEPIFLPNQKFYIVEGAYSAHPKFGIYYQESIFLDIDKDEQKRRILLRNGEDGWKQFKEKWIVLEENYFPVLSACKK